MLTPVPSRAVSDFNEEEEGEADNIEPDDLHTILARIHEYMTLSKLPL